MPKVNPNESHENYMARCNSDIEMNNKYPSQTERTAMCHYYWKRKEMSTQDFVESYTDYPKGASNNAKRALEWVDKHGWGSCGESSGKKRAHQLANREPISRDTIARMSGFRRHQQHKDVPYSEGCGGLMWDCWGGESGISWAENKLKEIDKK